MQPAIGLVETNSIAVGIKVGDAMVKRAPVNLLEARTVCPGKYIDGGWCRDSWRFYGG